LLLAAVSLPAAVVHIRLVRRRRRSTEAHTENAKGALVEGDIRGREDGVGTLGDRHGSGSEVGGDDGGEDGEGGEEGEGTHGEGVRGVDGSVRVDERGGRRKSRSKECRRVGGEERREEKGGKRRCQVEAGPAGRRVGDLTVSVDWLGGQKRSYRGRGERGRTRETICVRFIPRRSAPSGGHWAVCSETRR
jgi:hypothetical protein